jgi:hypothetical protein
VVYPPAVPQQPSAHTGTSERRTDPALGTRMRPRPRPRSVMSSVLLSLLSLVLHEPTAPAELPVRAVPSYGLETLHCKRQGNRSRGQARNCTKRTRHLVCVRAAAPSTTARICLAVALMYNALYINSRRVFPVQREISRLGFDSRWVLKSCMDSHNYKGPMV